MTPLRLRQDDTDGLVLWSAILAGLVVFLTYHLLHASRLQVGIWLLLATGMLWGFAAGDAYRRERHRRASIRPSSRPPQ